MSHFITLHMIPLSWGLSVNLEGDYGPVRSSEPHDSGTDSPRLSGVPPCTLSHLLSPKKRMFKITKYRQDYKPLDKSKVAITPRDKERETDRQRDKETGTERQRDTHPHPHLPHPEGRGRERRQERVSAHCGRRNLDLSQILVSCVAFLSGTRTSKIKLVLNEFIFNE